MKVNVSASRPRRVRPSHPGATTRTSALQTAAVALTGAIALIYGLLFAEVLRMDGLPDAERGIFGVAALVFVVLAGLLWWLRSRLLWGAVAMLQMLMAWMYVAIAPQREPAYEVWGLTIRALSVLLVLALVGLWAKVHRARSGRHPQDPSPGREPAG